VHGQLGCKFVPIAVQITDNSFVSVQLDQGNPETITGVTLRAFHADVSSEIMKLNALLMCRNQQSVRLITAVLNESHVGAQVCGSAADASDLLLRIPYSAIILDFDLPDASQTASMVRALTGDRKPILFAMIGAMTPVGGAVQAGANFVLYKPLEPEQVRHSFHAAYPFMKADRRHTSRHKVSALAYLELAHGTVPVLMLDLSEQGAALQAADKLPPVKAVSLRFILPETEIMIDAAGEMIWSEENGRAAMFFTRMTPTSRKHLNSWLAKRGARKRDAVRVLLPPHRARHTPRATQ
jgi:CheY-like chemotaxis protein